MKQSIMTLAFSTMLMVAASGPTMAQNIPVGGACDDLTGETCAAGLSCVNNNCAEAPEMPAILVPAFLLAGAGYIRHKRRKAAAALKTAEA